MADIVRRKQQVPGRRKSTAIGRKRWRPEILQDPNVPKPMHGLNLRVMLGDDWWDKVRHEAYERAGYRCQACGVPKKQARYHQWLEAHQRYHYDYATGRTELVEIVALCHLCKQFIHSGLQVALLRKGEITAQKFEDIYRHGFDVLNSAGLMPWWGTCWLWLQARGHSAGEAMAFLEGRGLVDREPEMAPWEDWHLVIPGDNPYIHYTMFESLDEWDAHYNGSVYEVRRRLSGAPPVAQEDDDVHEWWQESWEEWWNDGQDGDEWINGGEERAMRRYHMGFGRYHMGFGRYHMGFGSDY